MSHQLSKTAFSGLSGLMVLVLAACGSHDDGASNAATVGGAGTPSIAQGGSSNLGVGGSPVASSGGTSGMASNPASADDGLSCDVQAILKNSCSTCHGPTPLFGAPFSLVTAADVRAHGPKILTRIADDQIPMPPPPNARLTADDRAVLAAYINAGAPSSTCTQASGGSGGSSGGSGATSGSGATASTDPSVSCYKIVARASAANDKYPVPTTPDLYECFNYAPPWGNKKVEIVSTRPLIDNAQVLHHWLLYNNDGVPPTDGTHSDCLGAHPNSSLVGGWAPGGEGFTAPPDVGVEVLPGGFTLETHYNNKTGALGPDSSGAEICVTDQPRPNLAALHWLGTQNLNKQVASGTCVPTNTGDVTILRATPHMHLQGRHMTTVINRVGGGTEMLLDKAFDFQTQISYPVSAVIHRGDTLTTTCTFATPTPFGERTTDEMCYDFILAYPAGGLSQLFSFLRKYDCTG